MNTETQSPQKLADGLFRFGKGRGTRYLYIKDGILHLPASLMLAPIVWLTCGKPLTMVEKRVFMRAADIIEELPEAKTQIEALATKHGLAV